jgi:hypothetical protein
MCFAESPFVTSSGIPTCARWFVLIQIVIKKLLEEDQMLILAL